MDVQSDKKVLMADGVMTFGELADGLRVVDFACFDEVELDACIADFKVQIMRDGNVYMTQRPKRVRRKPLFRDDNASLSRGRDGRYYFVFSLPGERLNELPQQLVRQAGAIAQKALRELVLNNLK